MTGIISTRATKKLVLRLVLDNLDCRKKNQHLQEIVALGKKNSFWWLGLTIIFDTPFESFPLPAFALN
jgi:hypothetical protein